MRVGALVGVERDPGGVDAPGHRHRRWRQGPLLRPSVAVPPFRRPQGRQHAHAHALALALVPVMVRVRVVAQGALKFRPAALAELNREWMRGRAALSSPAARSAGCPEFSGL